MRKIKFIAGILLALLICTSAQAKLPKTYKEFKERYQTEGKTIEGAVKLYFEGVFAFMNEETRKEGGKMLRYAMYSDRPIERSTYYATFVERMKDPDYNYAFRSYAEGATPENNYSMSPDDFEIMYAGKPVKDPGGYMRVPLESSGADSPRIIWVKQYEDGLWYVINNAATYVQVKEPKAVQIKRSHAHDADYDEDEEDEPKKPAATKPDTPITEPTNQTPNTDMPPEDGFEW